MERFLKAEELQRLEKILELEEGNSRKSPYVLWVIRMLMYTGMPYG